jgi:hypothetical protein
MVRHGEKIRRGVDGGGLEIFFDNEDVGWGAECDVAWGGGFEENGFGDVVEGWRRCWGEEDVAEDGRDGRAMTEEEKQLVDTVGKGG